MLHKVKTKLKYGYYTFGVGMTMGMMGLSNTANAQETNFTTLASNITESSAGFPGMVTGVSYIMGTLLAALGVMKIKDHVEKPDNTPLKDGAIRLAAGGGLFALPILSEAMLNTLGEEAAIDPTQNALTNVNAGALFTVPGGN